MLSIVVPVYNEEESLRLFYKELHEVLDPNSEILFIDDGSTDSSLEILKDIVKKDKRAKVFAFRRNQGKAEALMLGFQKAKGEYLVTLDADLQDKPNQIEKLLNKAKEGYDLVCGWRKERKDPARKIISSRFFNALIKLFWGLKVHDYNCGLKVYTSQAAKSLNLYGGLHRFIPLFIFQDGFLVTEVAVEHEVRKFGKSKYGFSKLWKDLPDIFTMIFLAKYSKRPLHFFGPIGLLFLIAGLLILFYLYFFVHAQGQTITSRPLFFFGIISMLGGLQILFTGFLADLIINKSYGQNSPALKFSTE